MRRLLNWFAWKCGYEPIRPYNEVIVGNFTGPEVSEGFGFVMRSPEPIKAVTIASVKTVIGADDTTFAVVIRGMPFRASTVMVAGLYNNVGDEPCDILFVPSSNDGPVCWA